MSEKTYIGNIAFDGGDKGRLESRQTKATTFLIIGDWMRSVIEHYQGEFRYNPDCEWFEVRVSVYENTPEMYTVNAMPIQEVVLRSPYRD